MKKKRRIRRWAAFIVAGLAIVYSGAALVMISLPLRDVSPADKMSKEEAIADGMTLEQNYESETCDFTMRDGTVLRGTRYPATSSHSLLFLHGASGHSSQLNNSIGGLGKATGFEVFAYDHRGHGHSPGKRGDLDHVNQYATDLSDVLKAIKKRKPMGKVILAGHSMGGGIIQRYAMSNEPELADAYLLFAPVLGMGVPGETMPSFVKPHIPRIIGIRMFDVLGIDGFNHLPVVNMGFPEFDGHINQYTYTSVLSMRPSDWQEGIAALRKPSFIIMGGSDTAKGVSAEKLAVLIKEHSDAEVLVIPGEGHHVQNHPDAIAAAADWVRKIVD